jgi:hypothetical protein
MSSAPLLVYSQEELIVIAHNRVIRSRGGHLGTLANIVARVLQQKLPLVCRVLQGVQVESY